jgi:hypothetical protein
MREMAKRWCSWWGCEGLGVADMNAPWVRCSGDGDSFRRMGWRVQEVRTEGAAEPGRGLGWEGLNLNPHPLKTEGAAPKCREDCGFG